jgi:16S rRNA (uracil1498-N3)-methyltransferase
VPEVLAPERLDRLLDGWEAGRSLIFCDEAGDALPLLQALSSRPEPKGSAFGAPEDRLREEPGPRGDTLSPWVPDSAARFRDDNFGKAAILIGPEGGFDPAERDRLRALPFTKSVSLGPRVLRADTAAISALTLWQAAAGDWL